MRKVISFENNDGIMVHALFMPEVNANGQEIMVHHGTYATREEADTITKKQVEANQSNLDL